jgi:hypothetical protein
MSVMANHKCTAPAETRFLASSMFKTYVASSGTTSSNSRPHGKTIPAIVFTPLLKHRQSRTQSLSDGETVTN